MLTSPLLLVLFHTPLCMIWKLTLIFTRVHLEPQENRSIHFNFFFDSFFSWLRIANILYLLVGVYAEILSEKKSLDKNNKRDDDRCIVDVLINMHTVFYQALASCRQISWVWAHHDSRVDAFFSPAISARGESTAQYQLSHICFHWIYLVGCDSRLLFIVG